MQSTKRVMVLLVLLTLAVSTIGQSSNRPTQRVCSVAFSPNGKYVLTGFWDGTAELWDADTGREIHTFIGHKEPVISVALSLDGRAAFTGTDYDEARAWDVATGEVMRVRQGNRQRAGWSIAFSPGGVYAFVKSDDHAGRLWETATGRELPTFSVNAYDALSTAFSPNGQFVVGQRCVAYEAIPELKRIAEAQNLPL